MEKYNKILKNITELIEKGLFASKNLKKEVEHVLKFKAEDIVNKLPSDVADKYNEEKTLR